MKKEWNLEYLKIYNESVVYGIVYQQFKQFE